jgi:predicted alpha/beta hydrolase family esterase
MNDTTLIVPGYHGSGVGHWQTWLENTLPGSRRVSGIDWESPILPEWTSAIHREIDRNRDPVWLVAHSFGCLASVVVASERTDKIAGIILVAPADPQRFSITGIREDDSTDFKENSISGLLPDHRLLAGRSALIASENDPWLEFTEARRWAAQWGSVFINAGQAGHINTESGFGPWPFLRQFVDTLQQSRFPVLTAPESNSLKLVDLEDSSQVLFQLPPGQTRADLHFTC